MMLILEEGEDISDKMYNGTAANFIEQINYVVLMRCKDGKTMAIKNVNNIKPDYMDNPLDTNVARVCVEYLKNNIDDTKDIVKLFLKMK